MCCVIRLQLDFRLDFRRHHYEDPSQPGGTKILHLSLCADDFNVMCKNTNITKKTRRHVVTSKETDHKVNSEKTMYIFMSYEQNSNKITT